MYEDISDLSDFFIFTEPSFAIWSETMALSLSVTPAFQPKPRLLLGPISPLASIPKRSSYTSCNQNKHRNGKNSSTSDIDRRNMLIGLGALYGASASPILTNTSIAAPIQAPDLTTCHEAYDDSLKEKVVCCKPVVVTTIDFKFPDPSEPLRVRRPAKDMSQKDLAKFIEAIAKMKALPEDDPRNFIQQAQVHCSFCQDAYDQPGFPNIPVQVHGSWIFPAWHRFYVYFWEKILGNLIGDPTFAIPYWNWSDPEGMYLPEIYLDEKSPLYNGKRNKWHYDALLDFKYSFGDANPTSSEADDVILANLRLLNNDFTESKNTPKLFMGRVLRAGEEVVEEYGYLETVHNTIHQWVGPSTSPYWDMGNLHTAARDTVFWGHHANVDRLWNTYQLTRNMKPEFDTTDWLDATFVFPDPDVKGQAIKCKVRDSLDPSKFRYTYESVQPDEQQFLQVREKYLNKKKASKSKLRSNALTTVEAFGSNPRVIDTTVRVLVNRPKASRTKDEKEKESEVLLVDNIDYDDQEHARFDVYIAKPTNGKASSDLGELAGSYVKIPNSHNGKKKPKNTKRFGITNLLDDIDAEDSDRLVVSFVPRFGEVTVGGVSIEFV
uniref:Polyphenol oxidase n=1 Tax=Sinopodophyllum hexandrum TaxID=93608 RepID=A0A0N9HGV8_SINHE|nr:polyphenol oxidase [Sinopodophyllum hexandrum]